VSVGQKLIEKGVKGGYTDAAGTVTANLKTEIMFVDAAIGQMTAELKKQGLLETTLIIVTAKHGQSPIDPNRFQEIGTGITTTPADVLSALYLPPPPAGGAPENPNTPAKITANGPLDPIGPTQDDISLLWLATGADTSAAVNLLEANGGAIGLGQIFYGPSLETMFNAPGLPPNGDPRTPDIIVQPNVGVIYTGSHKKQEEHGGFAQDDTNVMILVSNPSFAASTVTSFVETTEVAPTILQALGLDPNSLGPEGRYSSPTRIGLQVGAGRIPIAAVGEASGTTTGDAFGFMSSKLRPKRNQLLATACWFVIFQVAGI